MKIIIILFFVLLNLINAQENNKIIAFAQDTMANDFRKAQVFEAKEHSKKYNNIDFVYSDAKGQTSLLIKQIDNFKDVKIGALNTNMQYLPISEIEDTDYNISPDEIIINKAFYGIENE